MSVRSSGHDALQGQLQLGQGQSRGRETYDSIEPPEASLVSSSESLSTSMAGGDDVVGGAYFSSSEGASRNVAGLH